MKEKISKSKIGSKNPMWKGGITSFLQHLRSLKEYKEWKKGILKKAGYSLEEAKRKNLQIHHLKPLKTILEENQIDTIQKAKKCKELWDLNNGVPLRKIDHYFISILQRKKDITKEYIGLVQNFIDLLLFEKWRMESQLKSRLK